MQLKGLDYTDVPLFNCTERYSLLHNVGDRKLNITNIIFNEYTNSSSSSALKSPTEQEGCSHSLFVCRPTRSFSFIRTQNKYKRLGETLVLILALAL